MKTLRFYSISKADYEGTNYRPVGVETVEIKTEDGWNYGDVIENSDGYAAQAVKETESLIIWKVLGVYPYDEEEQYIVEIKGVI